MPTPLHESIGGLLNKKLSAFVENLPEDTGDRISMVTGEDYNSFGGGWFGSGKRPDLGIQIKTLDGNVELKWILETGFSETYNELLDDVRLWLEGLSEVAMVVIVKFGESPKYRCPGSFDQELEDQGLSEGLAVKPKDIILRGDYGPATYNNLVWVGNITEIFMENWIRGPNGKAKKQGSRKDLLRDAEVQILPRDFLDLPDCRGSITINLTKFRSGLKDSIRRLAAYRCNRFIIDYMKRMRNRADDEDYQP